MRFNLGHIKDMLDSRHRTRNDIMVNAIEQRLNKSLLTYIKTLDSGVEYVANKSEINVLKKL